MKEAVKFSTIVRNAGITVIIISVVCYAKNPSWTSDSVLKLDMAPDSVDDQFTGCEDKTYNLITDKYLQKELEIIKRFGKLWDKYKNISDEYVRIIKVYTDPMKLYEEFNIALRSSRKNYKNSFNYKSVHFFLTRAVQKYKVTECVDVIRRTKVSFDTNILNHEMRFGHFASSSLDLDSNLNKKFGSKSCFMIKTRYGANIANISVIPEEKEVLIPPFEKFKITKIDYNQRNCSVLFTLQSTGIYSNMNCELTKRNINVHYGKSLC